MPTELFEPGADDVVYLVDLSGYVFRAYHAITPLTSPSGEPTHAVFGTVNMLERLIRERRPHMLAVAMDSRTPTFRKKIYEDYKAHRPPPPPDLKQQLARCEQIIEAFAVPVFREDGYEADDLIATFVRDARQLGLRVVIVSADKDLMQLVGPDVILWDTMRDRVFGPDEVQARFGVPVHQVRDLLALMGDSSDNIPGVPSVGPKTARDLLLKFESVEGIYAHLDAIERKKLRETLAENHDRALLSQALVTLSADVEIDLDRDKLVYGGRDIGRLRSLYEELGFTKHLAALGTFDNEPRPSAVSASTLEREGELSLVRTDSELRSLLERAQRSKSLALAALFTDERPTRAQLVGLGLSPEAGVAGYVPLAHRYVGAPEQLETPRVLEALAPYLADPAIDVAAHDVKQVDVVFQRLGAKPLKVGFDSLLAAYVLDPAAPNDLEALAERELGIRPMPWDALTKKRRGHQLSADEVAVEDALEYAAARADAVQRLAERLRPKLAAENLTGVLDDIELPLAGLLASMELEGVLVDVSILHDLSRQIEKQLAELEKRAHDIAGKPFNVNSPRQLETLLFDDVGLKPIKRTKTSRSTDAATLEALAEQHPLPEIILEIRQLAKLKGTYIDALPELVHPETGRIHTRWGQAVAATGRLSSYDPNLQNIPIRTELGRAIRRAFVARPEHVVVSADYSQIELRVLAHLSEDAVLVDAFKTNQDVHTRTAMEIFSMAENEVTPELRRRAKAVNFGVIYGQGESGLAKSLGIPRAEAARFIQAYFDRYEGVRRFMEATLEQARAGESVRTLFGRRRLVPDIKSGNRAKRFAAERIAMNTPIQGTAADLLKLAMLSLKDPVTPGTKMILTVHDELVFEVPTPEASTATARIREAMEKVYELRVPLVVDVGHGPNWGEAH